MPTAGASASSSVASGPRTRHVAAFLVASSIGASILLIALGASWRQTALLPVTQFATGHQGTGSWAALEKGHAHFKGPAREDALYDATFFSRRLEGHGFQYPPTSLLVMRIGDMFGSPRRFFEVVTWLWVPVTAMLLVLLDRRVSAAAGATWSGRESWARASLAVLATLTFHPLMGGYAGGEVQTWVTGLFAAALLSWICGRAGLAGGLVAVMAAFKPQAAFLVLWAVARGQWRFVAGFAAVAASLLAASIAAHGVSPHFEYLDVLAFLLRRGEAFIANQSLNGLLHRTASNGNSEFFFPPGTFQWRAHFPPYQPLVHAGTIISSLVLMGAALWPPRAGVARAWTADFCIAALTATIASPIAWEHDYGILLPVFVALLPVLARSRGTVRVLAALYVVAANPWWITRALAGTPYTPLQSPLLFAGLGTLGLLYYVHGREAVATAGVAGARGIRVRLDWRPTAAQAIRAMHTAGLVAVAAALVVYTIVHDRGQASTDVYAFWDPELFYMLNSLLPFKGHLYRFIDHPGTPVEVLGTALHAALWPVALAGSETLAELAVRQPWVFLSLAHVLLTAASVAVVALLACRVLPIERWDDVLLSLASACAFYVLHSHALQSLVYWSHNSFNFPAGGLLALLLFLRLRDDALPRNRWLLGMGVASGGLAAVQLYMAAWTGGIAIAVATAALLRAQPWVRALRSVAIVCAGSIAGFILFTLPIAPLYPKFLGWIGSLVSYQGLYGTGPKGFSMAALEANAALLTRAHPAVFVVMGLATLAIAAAAGKDPRSVRTQPGVFAVALAIAVQSIVLALATFKHPGGLYLLSIAALAPIQIAIAFACWRRRGSGGRAVCLMAAVAILFVFFCRHPLSVAHQALVAATIRVRVDRAQQMVMRESHADGRPRLRVWTSGTDNACFALWLANKDDVSAFSEEISRRCPRDGAAWDRYLMYPEAWRRLDPRSAKVVLVTTDLAYKGNPMFQWGPPRPMGIHTMFHGEYVMVTVGLDRLLAANEHVPMSFVAEP